MINSLSYLGIRSTNVGQWPAFAGDFLGMQVLPASDGLPLRLRMDQKCHRYLIEEAAPDEKSGLAYAGFAVSDAQALTLMRERLAAAGLAVTEGTSAEADARTIEGFIWLIDPDGNRVEIGHGLRDAPEPFVPGKPIGGFRTGELGLGHIVLYTPRFDDMARFYEEVLGCRLSDFHEHPFPARFLHVNPRHHSVALIGTNGPAKIHHVMCEYLHFDDVGRAYDVALDEPERIAVTLGRHLNDHVTSFYAYTPDDFFIEIGWAGRLIDDATWVPEELTSPSLWGHVRNWLPPGPRADAKVRVRALAARGVRAPIAAVRGDGFAIPTESTKGESDE
jgi:2,3-dihydroxybiphenyl 1,2-dioxygenase